MIISTQSNTHITDFEELLEKTKVDLSQQALSNPEYFLKQGGIKFEKDVYDAICKHAKDTHFDNKIELISGHRFPDIVAYINKNKGLGIEVKTSVKNQWKSVGGSIFENTRLVGVEHIYLFFGKLVNPAEFRYGKYEDCLYNVAITHSPRYLIDMDLKANQTIFDKIGIEYDDLRNSDRPFAPIKAFLRKELSKKNEDIWWVDDTVNETEAKEISVRLWGNLSRLEKTQLQVEAMCLFPQIFGQHSKKYSKLATWLVARHGVVAPSLRDTFTAGGKVDLQLSNKLYKGLPQIFLQLLENSTDVQKTIEQTSIEDLQYYWSLENIPTKDKLSTWVNLVETYASKTLDKHKTTQLSISDFFRL